MLIFVFKSWDKHCVKKYIVNIGCELLRVIYKPLIKVLRCMYAYCPFKLEIKFANRKQVGIYLKLTMVVQNDF